MGEFDQKPRVYLGHRQAPHRGSVPVRYCPGFHGFLLHSGQQARKGRPFKQTALRQRYSGLSRMGAKVSTEIVITVCSPSFLGH